MKLDRSKMIDALRRVVQRMRGPLSFRNIEEMTAERGVFVDRSTLHRPSMKILPVLAAAFRRPQRPVGRSWRMDQTSVKTGAQWRYLSRSVACDADTVDCLLRAKRDRAAARAFFERAIDLHGVPDKVAIDKSGSDTAAIVSIQADSGLPTEMRQSKYLDNIVEQDHRAVERISRPMLGFKNSRCARILIVGIEVMPMIRKGHLGEIEDQAPSAANQFCSLAF